MTSLHLSILIALLIPALSAVAQSPPQLGRSPLNEVVDAMTTEEKAKLLVGMGLPIDIPGIPPMDPEDAKIPERVPGAAGRTHAIPRLGIPSLTLADGPAGVRIQPIRDGDSTKTFYATAFPVATLLASTWDPALVRRVGSAFGRETREYGVDILLAPGMNLQRNPLGGRNFEYYSEDPLVTGRTAAAFVEGVEAEGVGATIKHLVANNQEFNRRLSNSIVSERALRELYLKGFKIAVQEAQPWAVMSSYNLVNGTYTSQNPALLTTILRDEWGFEGFVMTDWWAGDDPVAQMKAGNDVIMPGNPDETEQIVTAVEEGRLSEDELNRNVEHVLDAILKSPTFRQYAYSDEPPLEANAELARRAAADGMVLLKNEDGALPLAPSTEVALFGNTSYELIVGGSGSGDVNEAYAVSLDEGLKHADFTVDHALEDTYRTYIAEEKAKQPEPPMPFMLPPPIPERPVDSESIQRSAQAADIAVITIGRNAGEGSDREEESFILSKTERALIRQVAEAFHAVGKKVVVVMNVVGIMEVASWRDQVDAILLAWQPGQEGGNAMADVLSGAVNPSGKLTATIPITYADVPSAESFPGRVIPGSETREGFFRPETPSKAIYDEGIYVGYRYYNTFDVEPAYAFGYGLSYTDFAYSDLTLNTGTFDGEVTATVDVTNTGDVAGREVVQLYVSAPAGKLDKPASELRDFAKTDLLQPGESQKLKFTLTADDLASYDGGRAAWIATAGTYTVKVGASSLNVLQEARFDVPEERVVEETHDVLSPDVEIGERAAPGQ